MGRKKSLLPNRYYFIDESGDANLFNKKGKVIVGTEGCSRYFILGLLDVPRPDELSLRLTTLRQDLLTDPYFRNIPSFDPAQKKTALTFHAKDDIPEVRREVFKLLHDYSGLQFFAVVKDKLSTVDYVLNRNRQDSQYRYHPNELYDYLVRCLCQTLLHKADQIDICFSRRGSRDRSVALRAALVAARNRFDARWNKTSTSALNVMARYPSQSGGLQAVDYFLWALQRFYTELEDRYVQYVWPACKTIIDLDDTRAKAYGTYYTQKKPLTRAALVERQADRSGI